MLKTAYTCALAAIFGLCQLPLSGQITFQKSYGDPTIESIAYDIIESADGYVIAGHTANAATGRDGLLMKLDFQGNVVWENTYDRSNFDEFRALARASDGGFVAAGSTQTPNDAWLVKVSPAGAIVWQKQFVLPNAALTGFRIQAVPNGHVLSGIKTTNNGASNPFAIRVDNDGNTLWSQVIQTPNSLVTVGYTTDSLYYAGGISNSNGVFMTLDPATGSVVSSKTYTAPGSESLGYISPSADGNFIMSNFAQPNWPSHKYFEWVQKITPTGEVLWSKTYDFSGQLQLSGPVLGTPDGGYLVCPGDGSNGLDVDAYLLKLDANGHINWCHAFGQPNGQEWFLNAIQTSDGGFIAAGLTANSGQGKTSAYVVKTNANGQVNGCCVENKIVIEADFPTTVQTPAYTAIPAMEAQTSFGTASSRSSEVRTPSCASNQPTLQATVALCPGETITLDGQPYTQPDTVVFEIAAANGNCDTLATYILTNAALGQNSQVLIQCPSDITKVIPAGATATPVTYAAPNATTDCTCPGLDISKTAGGASGSNFPVGSNTVCWMAKDGCGATNTCCFQVTITEEESSCDTKTTACLKWELLSVNRNAANQLIYNIRLTNTCATALHYAYFGLPSGSVPVGPDNNSVYTAPSGRQYDVRNPNFSPVYGLRFKSKTGALNGNQSDVFRFTLPPQTNPGYLYAAGRLDNAAFYEAHLNTFSCPIGVESNTVDRSPEHTAPVETVEIAPNPAVNGAILYLTGRAVPSGELLMTHISGQTVFRSLIAGNQVVLPAADLPAGIYLFQVVENGAITKNGKLVVMH